ncbi:termination factor Rho [Bacillus luti]|uniref:termination factor Rho n=1 Tax=Bacillus luti TaxID=2026191 RepID=UPI002896E7CD|nr:termination factor Rho [Bacillus luti]
MNQYKVVSRFEDTNHEGHIYEVGDTYPVEGKKASKSRLQELSTTKNKYQQVFIEEVKEKG